MSRKDQFGIVASVIQDPVLRTGAKVWIHSWRGDFSSVLVHAISRGGRIVEKWIAFKRLENFRAAWIPDHCLDRVHFRWDTKAEADENANALADYWRGVRSFKPDGTLIRDGISENEARERAGEARRICDERGRGE